MAMTQGTVTINASGAPSGNGAAREVFDFLDATIDYGGLMGTDLQGARQRAADLANAIAYIIPHIKTNATAVIEKETAGLQSIPKIPVSEDDPCKGPSDNKYLGIE